MRKVLLVVLFAIGAINTQAQTEDIYLIRHEYDVDADTAYGDDDLNITLRVMNDVIAIEGCCDELDGEYLRIHETGVDTLYPGYLEIFSAVNSMGNEYVFGIFEPTKESEGWYTIRFAMVNGKSYSVIAIGPDTEGFID